MKYHPITGCRASALFGAWFIEPEALQGYMAQALSFDLKQLVDINQRVAEDHDKTPPSPMYTIKDGIATLPIKGVLTKGPTSFDNVMDTSHYAGIKANLKELRDNPQVKQIVAHFDECPGGTAYGCVDCAKEWALTNSMKPITSYVSDLCTSAGYMLASQSSKIYAGSPSEVGSIGTMAILRDTSGAYAKEGIKVIPIVTGKYKGSGTPGAPITEEQLAYVKERLMALNKGFEDRVQAGRKFSNEKIRQLADEARVYSAEQAVELGLIDGVCSLDELMSNLTKCQVPKSGPSGTPKILAASKNGALAPRSNAMALTAEQIAKIRALPGAANMTEENVDQTMFDIVIQQIEDIGTLQTKIATMVPKSVPVDPELTKGRCELTAAKIDHLVNRGFVTKAQSDVLKTQLCVEQMVTPVGGKAPADGILQSLELNKPNGLMSEQSGSQPQPRETPGDENKPNHMKAADDFSNRRYGAGKTIVTSAK